MRRELNGMPVVEATDPLYVQPTEEDFINAIPGDPSNCAYALCLKRLLGVDNVYVLRTKAYIQSELGGKPVIKHYLIKKNGPLYDNIKAFDEGEETAKAAIVKNYAAFEPPPLSQQLDYERPQKSGAIIKSRSYKQTNVNWRNGTGRVKFGIIYE